ncbi:PulJ/GspJ family protein [Bradyrhizobium brasilense]|uniref:Type II secretion system protein n=1 Tax=Bradyrhizobium brasilense TaxID=1419277 RepID=A0ABY8JRQ2_9BRAD|nr:type II secretion system protein [Bradyrhizobium brasilense]WFU66688.1 type II secretion system protein [Bradyrhizobium brasilense]
MKRVATPPFGHAAPGFTLVELLVSLAIASLIASFAVAGVRLATRAWTRTRDANQDDEIDAGIGRLSDLLCRATPSAAYDASRGIAALRFRGHREDITFVTLSEGHALFGGLIEAQITWARPDALSEDPERPSGAIILNSAVFRPNGAPARPSEPVVLLRAVTGLKIEYLGSVDPAKPLEWHPDWQGQDRLPALVSIHIDVMAHGKPRHLHLNVPLRHAPS